MTWFLSHLLCVLGAREAELRSSSWQAAVAVQGEALPRLTLAQALARLASAPLLSSHLLPPCGKLSLAAEARGVLRK